MKKLLTIILTVVMLLGVMAVNTSAADTPSVTIVTNKGSAVTAGKTTYFTIKFENFDSIKGMDVTIKSLIDGELAGGVLEVVSVTNFGNMEAKVNKNYTINKAKDTIRFVDLTAGTSGSIVVKVTAPSKSASIEVTGKYAQSSTELFTASSLDANGTIEVKADVDKFEVSNVTDNTFTFDKGDENVFVPYGSVYKGTGAATKFAQKTGANTFTIDGAASDYSYSKFNLPSDDDKITTYGAADDYSDSNKLTFGSYSENDTTGFSHGTMVFEGDFLGLKNYYIQNGITVKDFVTAIYKDASDKLGSGETFVSYKHPNGGKINVYLFPQQKYMWKDGNGILEYAVRLSNIQAGKEYAAVAYAVNGSDVKISDNVKSVQK